MPQSRQFLPSPRWLSFQCGAQQLRLGVEDDLPALKKNPDGSLTLHIQKGWPGKSKEANWMPAPDGPIYLVMRVYWPKETAPSVLPAGDGTWKPPGTVASK